MVNLTREDLEIGRTYFDRKIVSFRTWDEKILNQPGLVCGPEVAKVHWRQVGSRRKTTKTSEVDSFISWIQKREE